MHQGGGDETALQDQIAPFLAADDEDEDEDEDEAEEPEGAWDGDEPDPGDDDEDLDDADAFVEVKLARFFTAIGLPLPDDLVD